MKGTFRVLLLLIVSTLVLALHEPASCQELLPQAEPVVVQTDAQAVAVSDPPLEVPGDYSHLPWLLGAIFTIVTIIISWIPTSKPWYDVVSVVWKLLTYGIQLIWPNHRKEPEGKVRAGSPSTSPSPQKRSWIGRLVHSW